MATTKIAAQSMVVTMSLGQDKNGKAVFKNITLKNLKPNVVDNSILAVVDALKTILPNEITNVSRNTVTDIYKDA